MSKTHNPTAKCSKSRFASWQRRNLEHWRDWNDWRDALIRRMEKVLRNHLARGGKVVECFTDPRCNITWSLRKNCFAKPAKSDPDYIAKHLANRMINFGWSVQLI